ncbi:hypothetical protein [Granulicella sp. dw_53]|uniref:hypothetical protein n=1 Tax=Granulicella sp. dw_53 TaxID=2719792 RepID=UPI001BD57049|nr:hypothetical protein [Granulicella sp. dw_53]
MLFLIAIPSYLYLNLFTFPNVPFFLLGDQNFFWVYAMRMFHGERGYQDFFQFTPPGTDLFYLALFRIFGLHLWVTNAAVFILGVALCWICFHVAQRLMERDLAVLTSLLFLVYIYGDRLDATHHWFGLFVGLSALSVVLTERTLPRIAIAGLLLGVASFFTQTTGVAGVASLVAALAWERFSRNRSWQSMLVQQLLLSVTFALTLSVLSTPWLLHVGWRQLWYLQVTYPLHYVVPEHNFWLSDINAPHNRSPLLPLIRRQFLYLLLLVIYPSILWHCWRRRREIAARYTMQLVLICLFGLSLLLVIITRPDLNRIHAASMPAILLMMWAVSRLDKRRSVATAAIWVVIAFLAVKQIRFNQHSPHQTILLPAGKVAVSPLFDEKFSWIMQHTRPEDLFFQAQGAVVYLPLQLFSPAFVDYLWTGEPTRPEYIDRTVRELERQPARYVLWSQQHISRSDGYHAGQNRLAPFYGFLITHYRREHVFSDGDEVWERP